MPAFKTNFAEEARKILDNAKFDRQVPGGEEAVRWAEWVMGEIGGGHRSKVDLLYSFRQWLNLNGYSLRPKYLGMFERCLGGIMKEEEEEGQKQFTKHLEEATKIVGTWPVWKQNILKHSTEPTNKVPRVPVDNGKDG